MTKQEMIVTKYIACDDQEFITLVECESHLYDKSMELIREILGESVL